LPLPVVRVPGAAMTLVHASEQRHRVVAPADVGQREDDRLLRQIQPRRRVQRVYVRADDVGEPCRREIRRRARNGSWAWATTRGSRPSAAAGTRRCSPGSRWLPPRVASARSRSGLGRDGLGRFGHGVLPLPCPADLATVPSLRSAANG
jgi:hypothetical protein